MDSLPRISLPSNELLRLLHLKITPKIIPSVAASINGNPLGQYGARGGISPKCITNKITDQNMPYCDELRYAVSNDIRMLEF